MNSGELKELDLSKLSPEELGIYSLVVYRLRKRFEQATEEMKKLEKAAGEKAGETFLVGVEKSELKHGTFKHTESEFMGLPDEGWPAVYQKIVTDVNNGADIMEAFDIISYQRLNTKHFEEVNDDKLPIGITRSKKTGVKFTPKRNIQL